MARGSLNEAKYWLRRASRRNLTEPEEMEKLNRMMEDIGPSLNAYLKSLDRSNRQQLPLNPKHKTLNTKN
jgi:four helix bundle protein